MTERNWRTIMAQMHGISTSPLMEIKWEGKLLSLSGGGLSNIIFSSFKRVEKKKTIFSDVKAGHVANPDWRCLQSGWIIAVATSSKTFGVFKLGTQLATVFQVTQVGEISTSFHPDTIMMKWCIIWWGVSHSSELCGGCSGMMAWLMMWLPKLPWSHHQRLSSSESETHPDRPVDVNSGWFWMTAFRRSTVSFKFAHKHTYYYIL